MDTPKWIARVAHAGSSEEVMRIVQEYLATRNRNDLACLPDDCRFEKPPRTPSEIADCAYRLATHHGGQSETTQIIERISGFFSRASVRLAELAHE